MLVRMLLCVWVGGWGGGACASGGGGCVGEWLWVCGCVGVGGVGVGVRNIILCLMFLRIYCVQRGILTFVAEISRYRNDRQ